MSENRPKATLLVALILLAVPVACGRAPKETIKSEPTEKPDSIVAATRDGKVVLLSLTDGSLQRVLAETAARGVLVLNSNDGAPYIVLDPKADTALLIPYPSPGQERGLKAIGKVTRHGNEIYFDIAGPPCFFESLRVSAEGGKAEMVRAGAWPTISPDGDRIAVVTGTSERACRRTIEVSSSDGREKRTWTLGSLRRPGLEPFEEPPGVVGRLSWAPDSQFLAYEVWSLGHSHLRLLDTRTSGGELPSTRLGPEPSIASWRSPNYLSDGTLGILCTLCPPDNDDPAEFWLVEGKNGKTKTSEALPATRPGQVTMTDQDPTGETLIWLDSQGSLWLRNRSREPVKLGEGYAAASV